MSTQHDKAVLRDLATQYAEIAADTVQDERRRLWRDHNSLRPTRVPVLATYGMWNVWCRETFSDARMECADPLYRELERWLRMEVFHDGIGDDYICEPWVPVPAVHETPGGIYGEAWGVDTGHIESGTAGGAWRAKPPIVEWEDMAKLRVPHHAIDEEATRRRLSRLHDAIGDIVELDLQRGPILSEFAGDISTTVVGLRGLEQIMVDMYESPEELHELLAFLRDGVLANQREAEEAGDITLTVQRNQAMPYAEDLEAPTANSGSRWRGELWGFFAAQEYTLISPDFHEEFLLRYQTPIMEKYGLIHYGCCEDLTRKIDMLRAISNLRSIAVTPTADVRACAEQIGRDYAISWRPNPTDAVCAGWDAERIRRVVSEGRDACRGGIYHIHLKDVETVQGDPSRLKRWSELTRSVVG